MWQAIIAAVVHFVPPMVGVDLHSTCRYPPTCDVVVSSDTASDMDA